MKKGDEWHRIRTFIVEDRTGTCSVCGPVNVKIRVRNDYNEVTCMNLVRKRRREYNKRHRPDPEKVKLSRRDHAGQTVAERAAAIEAQGGLCKVCKCEAPLHADHDHKTGQKRAMLCQRCNIMLGWSRDDPQILRDAADYLDSYL